MNVSNAITKITAPILGKFGISYIPFSQEWNGLGNRVKGLCNFYSYVGGKNRNFIMLWNTRQWVTAPFNALFTLDGCRIVEINNGFVYSILKFFWRRFIPCSVVSDAYPFWSFILPDQMRRPEFTHRWSFCAFDSYSVDWWFDKTPDDVREYYRPFFKALQPSKEVLRRIRSFEFDLRKLVGVQIRNSNNKEDQKDVASIETIIQIMNSFDSDQHFFISCMKSEVAERFHLQFGIRVHELPVKDYTSMIDAVADMWLLGHCREMVASPESTFSEVSWWWGGAVQPVRMVNAEFNQRQL